MGLISFVIAHPYVRALLPSLCHALVDVMPFVIVRLGAFKERLFSKSGFQEKGKRYPEVMGDDDGTDNKNVPLPLSMVVRRAIDDDRLSDECWNSEMREVQLWENERFGGMCFYSLFSSFFFVLFVWLADAIAFAISSGPIPPDSATLIATTMGASSSSSTSSASSSSAFPHKGWSKQNLRAGERSAWTRGRDGWNGVGVGGHGSMVEGSGEVRFVYFWGFFCVLVGCFFFVVWMFLFRCGNDRRQSDADTFPALLLLL